MPITKYGVEFKDGTDLAQIEVWMIRKGGQWTGPKSGKLFGNGLFYHYKELQKLLWPEEVHHRWTDLILETILSNTIVPILGPKDSGKTRTTSKYALTDYFCFPEETLILISSTDLRGLEMRVWGDLKTLWQRASERYDWIPGNVLESKHAIATDNLEEDQVRDMRKGIMCFVAGTLVDTPIGQTTIEQLSPGDEVVNAIGVGRIKSCQMSFAPKLVRVHLSSGKKIDCTPEHPFFTRRGWVDAVDLKTCDVVFSANEAMRLLQEPTWSRLSKSQALLRDVSELPAPEAMRTMQQGVSGVQVEKSRAYGKILQYDMRESLGCPARIRTKASNEVLPSVQEAHVSNSPEQNVLLCSVSGQPESIKVPGVWKRFHVYPAFSDEASVPVLQQILQAEMERSSGFQYGAFRQHQSREDGGGFISGFGHSLHCVHGQNYEAKLEALVPNRHCISEIETRSGNRRWGSQNTSKDDRGRQENERVEQDGVDRVEVLEQRSDERFIKSEGGYRVYNLEVSGHPSYSVNGVIVHNCIPCMSASGQWTGISKYIGIKQKRRRLIGDEFQFMRDSMIEAIANLNSGDFKGVFLGNPIGQEDPLDKVSEPKEGWTSLPEPEKTTTWKNRWVGGVTVNLVGTDSPNFDQSQDPHPKYPWMINKRSIAAVEEFYGKESLQWFSQCKGVRRSGINARRVITRELCMQFHAFDAPVWEGLANRTKIAAADIAYGGVGGDRCVGGHGEFGNDLNGDVILSIYPPVIVPVSVKRPERPEDQIAVFMRDYCRHNNIEASHFGYDSTGRGTMGTAFARAWGENEGANVIPVEFGGKPTDRPVSLDLFILDDETKQKRHKLCSEHYSKFVTEMWFGVRYCIESDQLRGLPIEVAKEGYMREWKMTKGDKIEIETKEDTKTRMGRSPDLFDWLVTLLEVARRCGFFIKRIGGSKDPDADGADDWFVQEAKEQERILKGALLEHGI